MNYDWHPDEGSCHEWRDSAPRCLNLTYFGKCHSVNPAPVFATGLFGGVLLRLGQFPLSRDSQPQQARCLGQDSSWGGAALSAVGAPPASTHSSHAPPTVTTKVSPDVAKCPKGQKCALLLRAPALEPLCWAKLQGEEGVTGRLRRNKTRV